MGIDQPIALFRLPAARKGLDQRAHRQFEAEEARVQQRHAFACQRRAAQMRLGLEFHPAAGGTGQFGNAMHLQPAVPAAMAVVEPGQRDHIGGFGQGAKFVQQRRRQDRCQVRGVKLMADQPFPVAETIAQGHVDILPGEIDHLVIGIQPHRQFRVLHLETAQPVRQPVAGDGGDGRDRHRLRLAGTPRKRLAQHVERVRGRPGIAPAQLGQFQPPGLAQEQLPAQPFLQQLDLIADGGLGHAKRLGRPGEAELAAGGIEDAKGGKRGQFHKLTL